jgi:outer membrane receptor protein involved in Fe transport
MTLLLGSAPATYAQSTAADGSIEGTITDNSGAALPAVSVTITNDNTGVSRTIVSNDSGLYRVPLLPLGTYTVMAELQGFKKLERKGVTLSAGATAVVNLQLEVGEFSETIAVTVDVPVVDTAKTDAGRNLTENEVKNLPLVSRNPYNFALLQPGVTGFENPEFGVPRFSANGTLLRINYQIDGNTNTQKDRAGLRLLPVSEVMVREVKVITSGYAPEYGQTTGMVYNAITPSGTNTLHGAGAYRFRRKPFSAYPFFFSQPKTGDNRPDTKIDTITAELGGPVVKDKLHFFAGFENTYRDLSGASVITITPENQALLGLNEPAVIPREQTARFFIGKLDYQVSSSHRYTGRTIIFRNDSPDNTAGGLGSIQRTNDFLDAMESTSGQLVSFLTPTTLNELRVQYARRVQSREASEFSGTGPAINVGGAANFGGSIAASTDVGFGFTQGITQVIDNVTFLRGNHNYKAGFDIQLINDDRTSALFQLYTFPNVAAYLAAKNGTNPKSYTNYQQLLGNPNFSMESKSYSGFIQDDWRLAPNFKMLYGFRYDYYKYPEGAPNAPLIYNQQYNSDTNNFGPRVGIAWSPGSDSRSVIRASTGLMFDQMLLGAYEAAIRANGLPERTTVNVTANATGAPNFPNTLDNLPPGFTPPAQSLTGVDPDFQVARTWQTNVQYEFAIGQQHYFTTGYTHVTGDLLPVITNINPINPIGQLGDGRPIFGAPSAATRLDPRFNQINVVQSIGDSTYNALALQFGRRLSGGVQFDFNYTIGKGEDNAPLTSQLSVQGDDGVMDPTNLERDRGPNVMDTRHSFNGAIVAQPKFGTGVMGTIFNGLQFGAQLQFNSGLPQNVRSSTDLNGDGILADRPLGVTRNSIYLPARWNIDLRISRFVRLGGPFRAEVVAEFKNVMNTLQTASLNRILATNAAGELPNGIIPKSADDLTPATGYEQRALQIGFKLHF